MKSVFVITHAESMHHTERLVGGWFDSPLSAKGRSQAIRIATALQARSGEGSIALFSSDLKRAVQTSEPIAELLGVPMQLESDLRELSYGQAEGKPQQWLESRIEYPGDNQRLDHRPIEGAESKREFITRIYRVMDKITANLADQTIIVTHGYALTFVLCHWIRMPSLAADQANFHVASASISELQSGDVWRNRAVVSLSDMAHLEDK